MLVYLRCLDGRGIVEKKTNIRRAIDIDRPVTVKTGDFCKVLFYNKKSTPVILEMTAYEFYCKMER